MTESNGINNTIYDAVSNALENKINNCNTLLPSTTGKSTYDLAVDYGYVGTEREWINHALNDTELLNNLRKDAADLAAYINTIPSVVNDAINNTVVEGGVLADTFVTATAKFRGIARTQADKNTDIISINDIYGAATTDYSEILTNIATVKKGAVLDLGNKTLPASSVPDGIQLINGAIETGGKVISMPLTAKAHPITGTTGIILDDGVTHFWCHEMLHDIDTGKTLIFTKTAYRHGASLTAPLYMYVSEDTGLSVKTAKIIYNVRGSDIAEVRGSIMSNGRYGLLLTMRDTANVYTNDFLYSDDKGVTWAVIKNVTTTPNFVYSNMLQSPVNSNTFYVYGYLGGKQQVTKTTDNGLTWTNTAVGVGVGVTEPSVVKLPNQNKWLSFIRTTSNLYISTSTDMDNWTTARDTGIALNNNPVQAVIEHGKLYVYLFIRDFSETLAKQNTTLLLIDDYDYVYNKRSFSNSNLVPVLTGIDRQLGYMRICKTLMGNIFSINAGEYDGSTSYSAPSCIMLGGNYMAHAPTPNIAKPNFYRNGRFDLWSRGDTFTSSTNQKTADGWQTNNSGSTITASKYIVPTDISQSLPFRPKYGLKMVASTEDYVGLFQIDYSDTALTDTQNQIITIQVWGTGTVPELELGYLQWFGSNGSASQGNSGFKLEISNVGTDKMWYGVGRIPVPSIEGKDIGEGSYFRLNIQSRVNAAWDCVFLGVHAALSNQLVPYSVCDYQPTVEKYRCSRHLQVYDLQVNHPLCNGFAQNTTAVNALLTYSPKVKIPTISVVGSLMFYPAQQTMSAISFSSTGLDSSIMVGTTATMTANLSGFVRCSATVPTKVIIDCE